MGDVDDLVCLPELDERRLLHELKCRYQKNLIYTYIGDILISINPYKALTIYDEQSIKFYTNLKSFSQASPHIYAVADRLYHLTFITGNNQCCLISGESGAGKTESTKLILRHIVQQHPANVSDKITLHEQIIQMNPLIEAFGNAETLMNDNSSRFGKFIQLTFSSSGTLVGARIYQYLLERSRVVHQGIGERNFHIFYNLFAGLSNSEMLRYLLDRSTIYRIISPEQSCPIFKSEADYKRRKFAYDEVKKCLHVMGFGNEEVEAIFGLLAAILHITNVKFTCEADSSVYIEHEYELDIACTLLGVNMESLATALISTCTVVRGEMIIAMKNFEQAEDGRDALAKAIYSRLFSWLIRSINVMFEHHSAQFTKSDRPELHTTKSLNIGILDLAGFEDFPDNSFEQLCINIANEQLQFYFSQSIFAWEIQSYDDEGVKHSKIKFIDNKPFLDMLLEPPLGMLSLLEEECKLPRTTDTTLIEKFNKYLTKHDNYKKSKCKSLNFSLCHYAGEVKYNVNGFLIKNQDSLSVNVVSLLQKSASWIVYELFTAKVSDTGNLDFENNIFKTRRRDSILACKPPDMAKYAKSMSRAAGAKLKQKVQKNRKSSELQASNPVTISSHFRNSLVDLMAKLQMADPLFIRCIKPNSQKSSDLFDDQLVQSQLKYTGVMQTIKIRKMGFSSRLPFDIFLQRYQCLAFYLKNSSGNIVKICEEILKQQGLKDWQIGKTKVFLKYWHTETLNDSVERFKGSVSVLQNVTRRFICRRRVSLLRLIYEAQRTSVSQLCQEVDQRSAAFKTRVSNLVVEDARLHQIRCEEAEKLQQQKMLEVSNERVRCNSAETFIGQRVIPRGVDSVRLRGIRQKMSASSMFSSLDEFYSFIIEDATSHLSFLIKEDVWSEVLFMERDHMVERFYLTPNVVSVNGGHEPFNGESIGINHYPPVDDLEAGPSYRSVFGRGFVLGHEGEDIMIQRLTKCPLSVFDYFECLNQPLRWDSIYSRGILPFKRLITLYNWEVLRSIVDVAIANKTFDVKTYSVLSLVSISFDQSDPDLLSSPGWICVIYIKALDYILHRSVEPHTRHLNGLPPEVHPRETNVGIKQLKPWTKTNPRREVPVKKKPERHVRMDLRANNQVVGEHMTYSWSQPTEQDRNEESEILSILDDSFSAELLDDADFSSSPTKRVSWAKQKFDKKPSKFPSKRSCNISEEGYLMIKLLPKANLGRCNESSAPKLDARQEEWRWTAQ